VKTFVKIAVLSFAAFMGSGCAQNYYNIPRVSYEKKVRVLGVAPIFIDADSDIRLPEKNALIPLIQDFNQKSESELVARLKETGAYLSVRMPDVPADQLFSSLLSRRERRSDAGVVYNKYFYKQQELKDLIEKNNLDAVMLIVVSGLTMQDKVYSSNYLAYLEYDFNYLTMTAQIVDADGSILWEYPNFQQHLRRLTPLLNLQYPDFDEATANVTDKVDVKFKTIPGITRAFGKSVSSSAHKETLVSQHYNAIFDEMVDMLKLPYRFFWESPRVEPPREPRPEPKAAASALPKVEESTTRVAPAREEPVTVEPKALDKEPAPAQPDEIKVETLTPAAK
jgi:hypothetical protein